MKYYDDIVIVKNKQADKEKRKNKCKIFLIQAFWNFTPISLNYYHET